MYLVETQKFNLFLLGTSQIHDYGLPLSVPLHPHSLPPNLVIKERRSVVQWLWAQLPNHYDPFQNGVNTWSGQKPSYLRLSSLSALRPPLCRLQVSAWLQN